jgi:hypothetical protein
MRKTGRRRRRRGDGAGSPVGGQEPPPPPPPLPPKPAMRVKGREVDVGLYEEMLELLLKHGADINALQVRARHGCGPCVCVCVCLPCGCSC